MRKLALCFVLLLPFVYIYSQGLDHYYIEFKEGYELGEIQKTVNPDQTLTLSMDNTALAAALNEKPIFTFKRAFQNNLNPVLDRIYLVGLTSGVSFSEFENREEVERMEPVYFNEQLTGNVSAFTILPNDYYDLITGGRNTALDLIRAPLAWTITRGEGVKIGIADTKVDLNHEDLIDKIELEILLPFQDNRKHGTAISGQASARTNNNKGIQLPQMLC